MKPFDRVAIRTRCGDEQGWGNLFRLSWIITSLVDNHLAEPANIDFYVETSRKESSAFQNIRCPIFFLEPGISADKEEALLTTRQYDLSLIEVMCCSVELQNIFKNRSALSVVLDDLVDSVYTSDIVISGQCFDGHNFCWTGDIPPRFYFGYQYFFLNPMFAGYKNCPIRRQNKPPKKLLIAVGDEQYLPAHVKILDALEHFPALEITYVSRIRDSNGYLSKRLDDLKSRPQFCHIDHVENPASLFENADLAITGGGYAKLEAAITNTPMIVLPTQYHQVKLARKFELITGMRSLKFMSEVTVSEVIEALDQTLGAYEQIVQHAPEHFGLSELFDGYSNFFHILDESRVN